MVYFLRTLIIYLLLFGATAYAVSWGLLKYHSDDLPTEIQVSPTSLSLMIPNLKVQPRETESGLYLAGVVAQNRRDWQQAWQDFSRLNSKYTDNPDFALRAMTLALGNGEYQKAITLARNLYSTLQEQEESHEELQADKYDLMRLLILFSDLKEQDYAQALEASKGIVDGPLHDFSLPIIESWLNAENAPDDLNAKTEGLSPLQTYYKAFAAEYAGKDEIALKLMRLVDTNVMTPKKIEAIAAFYMRHDNKDKAIDIVRQALVKFAGSEDLGVLLAVLQRHKDTPISFPAMELEYTPKKAIAEAFHDFSIIMLGKGAVDSSLLFARLAAYLYPETDGVYLTIGDVLKYQGQDEQALDAYSKITVRDDAFDRAVAEQVDLLGQLEQPEQAEKVIRNAIQVELDAGLTQTPYFYFILGNVLREKKAFDEALEAYNMAEMLAKEQNEGEVPQNLWPLYYVRAIIYELTDQWDLAEQDLLTALDKFPESPIILNYLGYAYADRNINLDKAKDMISRAVMAAPNDAFIIDSMGWILYRMGDYEEAVNFLERAASLSPYHMVVNDHLGDAYWKVGRKIEAYYMWRRALDYYDPTDEEQQRMIDETRRKVKEGLD